MEALGTAGESARVTLVSPLPTPEEAQRTADDASAVVAAVPGGGPWSLRVEGTGAGGGTIAVAHGPGADTDRGVDPATGEPHPELLGTDAVADAVRLVAHDPVRHVFLSPGLRRSTSARPATSSRPPRSCAPRAAG